MSYDTPCADPILKEPRRNLFRGWLPMTPRGRWMMKFYRPAPNHEFFPPGYKERLATRGGLGPEPPDDEPL